MVVYYIKKKQLCTIQNRIWYSLLYKKKNNCVLYKIEYGTVYYIKKPIVYYTK